MALYSLDGLRDFIAEARQRFALDAERALEQDLAWGYPSFREEASPTHVYPLSPQLEQAWDELAESHSLGETLHVLVSGWNRGGLLVGWGQVQGFVPASQLRQVPIVESDDEREAMLARWVGEELDVKIIELDSSRNRLVFSERATQWGPQDGARLLEGLDEGQICHGCVSNVCDFGAFVDLGGLDGLIHISEMSWGRVSNPADMLSIGEEIKVMVLTVDKQARHVGLSLKRLQPNPWAVVEDRYQVGDIVEATITNVVDFGLFAQIEEGLEGLVHISEISDQRIRHPSDVARAGDRVLASILRIDCDRHRLSLSIKRVAEQRPLSVDPDLSAPTSAEGPPALLY